MTIKHIIRLNYIYVCVVQQFYFCIIIVALSSSIFINIYNCYYHYLFHKVNLYIYTKRYKNN